MSGRRDKAVTFMPNEIKIPKPPKQPDKPLPAYMRYSRKVWETVKAKHPDMKMWDIGKMIGEQWRNLPEDERQGFFAEYEVEKVEYQDSMKNYHNSNAYRDWLRAKEKAQSAIQEQQMMEKMIGTSMPKEEPRFQLQQIEDDDEEAEFSMKHISAARFQRNHRLITDIFSEATVPDIKTIVTKPRVDNLKKQVQSLMQHQRKLESEIEEMEERFSAKKRKILDKSNDFDEQIKEITERPLPPPPVVDETVAITTKENKDPSKEHESMEVDSTTTPSVTKSDDIKESPKGESETSNDKAAAPVSDEKPTDDDKSKIPPERTPDTSDTKQTIPAEETKTTVS